MRILAALFLTASTSPAIAQAQQDYIDFTFSGTVTQAADDVIIARNPGGSTTTLSGDQIPEYRYSPGDEMVTTFRIFTNQPVFSDTNCGGRFRLGFAQQNSGSCFAEIALVETPFGRLGMGGTGGDAFPGVTGLELVENPATGTFSFEMPTGSYTMRYVGVNPYFFDSATGELRPPTNEICVDAFNCPIGIITGNLTGWWTNIPIAGDFGQVRPGFDVGYDAGSAGTFSVSGMFNFGGSSSGGPVDVPAPAMPLLFGIAAGGLCFARRRRKKA